MGVLFTKVVDASGQRIHIQFNLTQAGSYKDVTLSWNAEKLSCELVWGDETARPLEV